MFTYFRKEFSPFARGAVFGFAALCFVAALPAADEAPIDMNRLRPIIQKKQRGEALTPEEQAYAEKAMQARRAGLLGQGKAPAPGQPPNRPTPSASKGPPVDTSALVPLTDMTAPYKGEDGGLYGGGRNTVPEAHQAAYLKESAKIQPLAANGQPAKDGKIGLITIGFSNTHLESEDFVRTGSADPQKSPQVVLLDGAIGLRSAVMWAYDGAEVLPKAEQERLDKEMDQAHMPKTGRKGKAGVDKDTWPTLDQRIKDAGLSAHQVQAVWMKHVEAGPRTLGDFPAHAKALQQDMADILIIAKKRFPNLRVAWLSSRTYGGWAGANSGSPEPFAYESGFAVRWLIQSQIKGDPWVNFDAARGEVKAPIMIWGPYLWANGNSPRKYDGMVWSEKDVRADDHMHPSEDGCKKVTGMLLDFLKTDPGASRWFLKPGVTVAPHAKNSAPIAPTVPPTAAPKPAVSDSQSAPINPERVRQLMQKRQAGQSLSAEDQAYLENAMQQLRNRQAGQGTPAKGGKAREPIVKDPNVNKPEMLAALVPLTELTGTYKGQDGGLYGGGRNEPPPAHVAAAKQATAKIRPLNAQGEPANDGKIVLISAGLSHTTMEFSEFAQAANADAQKSSQVVVVDCAQGGKPAVTWAMSGAQFLPKDEVARMQKEIETLNGFVPQANRLNEWDVADERLKTAGVTPLQVQAMWLKEAVPMPSLLGEFPAHARTVQSDITCMLMVAQQRYPNLRVVYLSSRSYGGYALDGKNPEPYANENGFTVRWVIQAQINGEPKLNYDPAKGPVTAPLLLWGPYLWAKGSTPRQSDGLVWLESDFGERDRMHPAPSGKQKVVDLLLKFFKNDPLANSWFLKRN